MVRMGQLGHLAGVAERSQVTHLSRKILAGVGW